MGDLPDMDWPSFWAGYGLALLLVVIFMAVTSGGED